MGKRALAALFISFVVMGICLIAGWRATKMIADSSMNGKQTKE